MLGHNLTVYLVTGLSGAGKSFVCGQVAPYAYRVKFDQLRGAEKRRQALEQASQQDKPIVADITKLVSTTILRNPEFNFKLVYVDEPLSVVKARLEKRGGTFNETAAEQRRRRLARLAQRFGVFTGTADECTQWLKRELRVKSGLPEPGQFYVYGIYELEPKVLRYVGKGHRNVDTGYDRVDHYSRRYFLENHKGVVFDKLRELVKLGRRYVVEIIEDGLTEFRAFERERELIRLNRATLWNRRDGGVVGWTLSDETCQKMSASRRGKVYGPRPESWKKALAEAARRRAADPTWRQAHSSALAGRRLSPAHRQAISLAVKGSGRPRGWRLSEAEKIFLELDPVQAGAARVELTREQQNKLRRFRYSNRGRNDAPGCGSPSAG